MHLVWLIFITYYFVRKMDSINYKGVVNLNHFTVDFRPFCPQNVWKNIIHSSLLSLMLKFIRIFCNNSEYSFCLKFMTFFLGHHFFFNKLLKQFYFIFKNYLDEYGIFIIKLIFYFCYLNKLERCASQFYELICYINYLLICVLLQYTLLAFSNISCISVIISSGLQKVVQIYKNLVTYLRNSTKNEKMVDNPPLQTI